MALGSRVVVKRCPHLIKIGMHSPFDPNSTVELRKFISRIDIESKFSQPWPDKSKDANTKITGSKVPESSTAFISA